MGITMGFAGPATAGVSVALAFFGGAWDSSDSWTYWLGWIGYAVAGYLIMVCATACIAISCWIVNFMFPTHAFFTSSREKKHARIPAWERDLNGKVIGVRTLEA